MGDSTQVIYLRARWYNPYLNQFIQPDTIVLDPRTPADWNRYAYVRNNPIRYTDPTGHRCKDGDENFWGYCGDKLPPPNKVDQFQSSYLQAVGRKYNVNLAPGDFWQYIDVVDFIGEGYSTSAYGWTPYGTNEFYQDRAGTMHHDTNDSWVVITQKTLNECEESIECVAGIMAHEATHSWIEHLIHLENSKSSTDAFLERNTCGLAEELFADAVAFEISPQNPILKSINSGHHSEDCVNKYGEAACANPETLWESYYPTIDLSSVSDLVFGRATLP